LGLVASTPTSLQGGPDEQRSQVLQLAEAEAGLLVFRASFLALEDHRPVASGALGRVERAVGASQQRLDAPWGAAAAPALTRTVGSPEASRAASVRRMRWVKASASALSLPGNRTTNSSPPTRAVMSISLERLASTSAMWIGVDCSTG
jgi:hypothetical protein